MKPWVEQLRARKHGVCVFLVWALFLSVLLGIGVPPDTAFVKDTAVHLDSVWRILQGQIPHRDYFASSGYDSYHFSLAALSLFSGPTVSVFHWFQVLAVVVIPWLTWGAACRRYVPSEALVLSLGSIILLSGLQTLGWPAEFLSSAAYYNKIGSSALLLFLIRFTRAPRTPDPWVGTFGICLVFAWMLAFKLPFALASAAIVTYGYVLKTESRKSLKAILLTVITTALVFTILFKAGWWAWWQDFRHVSAVYSGHLVDSIWIWRLSVLEICVFLFVCIMLWLGNEKGGFRKAKSLGVALAVGSLAAGVLASSTQWRQMPLLAIIPFLAPSKFNFRWKLGVALAFSITWVSASILSLGTALDWEVAHAQELADLKYHVRSPAFEQVAALGDLGYLDGGEWWVKRVSEGISVLVELSGPTDRIATLDFSNPFPVALHRPSALGGSIIFQDGFTHDKAHLPAADQVFKNTDIVMIPIRGVEDALGGQLGPYYYPYLQAEFPKVRITQFWEVRMRNR